MQMKKMITPSPTRPPTRAWLVLEPACDGVGVAESVAEVAEVAAVGSVEGLVKPGLVAFSGRCEASSIKVWVSHDGIFGRPNRYCS